MMTAILRQLSSAKLGSPANICLQGHATCYQPGEETDLMGHEPLNSWRSVDWAATTTSTAEIGQGVD
jgi:hypothetical protein